MRHDAMLRASERHLSRTIGSGTTKALSTPTEVHHDATHAIQRGQWVVRVCGIQRGHLRMFDLGVAASIEHLVFLQAPAGEGRGRGRGRGPRAGKFTPYPWNRVAESTKQAQRELNWKLKLKLMLKLKLHQNALHRSLHFTGTGTE
ncbi:hypothetical protein HYALB_00006555 [Hymenoscyphus albidus]|uniref:Uncharacterized protein n=1 Tax=Hymenoscyphus albidus TaxID=595503 RepID=A0A9N9LVL7_9HELO|nr:hypothetical protein HYALB_00006555 [Hymenoscyphus albidus]